MASPKRNTKKNRAQRVQYVESRLPYQPAQPEAVMLVGRMNKQLPLIVPDRWHCRFRYRASRTVTTTFASQPFWWAMSLNSVFDPDVSGVGGTCAGFAQIMAFYNKCVVVRTKATVTVVNNSGSASSTNPTRLALLASTASSSLTTAYTIPDACEQTYCAQGTLGSQGGNSSLVELVLDVPVHRVFGVKKSAIVDEISYYCTASADPTIEGTIQLGAVSMDGSSALAFIFDLDVEFEAICFNRVVFT